jgi:hypothetical protein
MMLVELARCGRVGGPAVGDHARAGLDVVGQERAQAGGAGVGDDGQSSAAEAAPGPAFDEGVRLSV